MFYSCKYMQSIFGVSTNPVLPTEKFSSLVLNLPKTYRDQSLSVIPGVMDVASLTGTQSDQIKIESIQLSLLRSKDQ